MRSRSIAHGSHMIPRIGFACKISRTNANGQVESIPELNSRSTTVAWLNRQPKAVAEHKLREIVDHNLASLRRAVDWVGDQPQALRCYRISSDILPLYTHPDFRDFWQQADIQQQLIREFGEIGVQGRDRDVRLSFHPGQFCCLASDDDDIVSRSIEELEYHASMARMMGYGAKWHDHGFKINIHISGRRGVKGMRRSIERLTPEARNLLTIENDENSWGVDSCLELADVAAIVLDVHHNWCREGEYIQPDDDRVERIVASWRGVRPILHYSLSREDVLVNHDPVTLPCKNALLESGHKKAHLRAHSDMMWNQAANKWVAEFLGQFDIMVECKSKNLGAKQLHDFFEHGRQQA